jgi:hypothetical protein
MLVLLNQLNPRDSEPFQRLIQHLLSSLTAASKQQPQELPRLPVTQDNSQIFRRRTRRKFVLEPAMR